MIVDWSLTKLDILQQNISLSKPSGTIIITELAISKCYNKGFLQRNAHLLHLRSDRHRSGLQWWLVEAESRGEITISAMPAPVLLTHQITVLSAFLLQARPGPRWVINAGFCQQWKTFRAAGKSQKYSSISQEIKQTINYISGDVWGVTACNFFENHIFTAGRKI